jgi:hypothetical protein
MFNIYMSDLLQLKTLPNVIKTNFSQIVSLFLFTLNIHKNIVKVSVGHIICQCLKG